MRFIPTTMMQSGAPCFTAIANGGVSGSYNSGSDGWMYHEFTASDNASSSLFNINVESGFTDKARLILIGGGGSGGNTGTGGTYHAGGGGGAGEVIQVENLQLFSGSTYVIQVGGGGKYAEPNLPAPNNTQNGHDGEESKFTSAELSHIADFGKGGNGNQAPTLNSDGAESGNGNAGGADNGTNVGGGGGGQTSVGANASGTDAGNGGAGITINLPYSSPTWGGTSKAVAGGGGGGTALSTFEGGGTSGGGTGSSNGNLAAGGERFTGGGGGGGEENISTGNGSIGADGIVILMYPTGSCG